MSAADRPLQPVVMRHANLLLCSTAFVCGNPAPNTKAFLGIAMLHPLLPLKAAKTHTWMPLSHPIYSPPESDSLVMLKSD